MKYIKIILFIFLGLSLHSCVKWKDAKATDPGITRHYCNDPDAVNYNWGFPGKPDNTICFYPSDLFAGVDSFFIDSIFQKDLSFTRRDSFMMTITRVTNSQILLAGFCSNNRSTAFSLTADRTYNATLDTVLGGIGQTFCRPRDSTMGDTVTGNITRDVNLLLDTSTAKGHIYIDTAILRFYFTVNSDTGITIHNAIGRIRKPR